MDERLDRIGNKKDRLDQITKDEKIVTKLIITVTFNHQF